MPIKLIIPILIFVMSNCKGQDAGNNNRKGDSRVDSIQKEIAFERSSKHQIGDWVLEDGCYKIGSFEGLYELAFSNEKIECIDFAFWSGNGTKYDLPEYILNFNHLKKLRIFSSDIVTLPDELSSLLELEELIITCENLKSFPDKMSNLLNLKRIFLSDMHGLKEFPKFIYDLPNLKSLHLSNFNKNLLLSKDIAMLSRLEILIISLCYFPLPKEIALLENLKLLDLSTYERRYVLPQEILDIKDINVVIYPGEYGKLKQFDSEIQKIRNDL